jgi:hypothetical protein
VLTLAIFRVADPEEHPLGTLRRLLTLVISINAGPVSLSRVKRTHARCQDFALCAQNFPRAAALTLVTRPPFYRAPSAPWGTEASHPPAGSRDRLGPGLRP